jgi:hypothetical protein
VTLHLALRQRPTYRAAKFDPDIDRAFNIFFGMDDIDQVRSCFEDCAAEKFPSVLMGNGACNSAVDPTYAPAGGHSAFWWPFAPYAVAGDAKRWDHDKAAYTENVLGVWREYAANLDDGNIQGKLLFTPLDIERLNVNMVRGAVRMATFRPSSASTARIHCCQEPGHQSKASTCAAHQPGTAAGSTGRPAISRRTRSPTTSASSRRGRGCRPRNGASESVSRRLRRS